MRRLEHAGAVLAGSTSRYCRKGTSFTTRSEPKELYLQSYRIHTRTWSWLASGAIGNGIGNAEEAA